MSGLSSEGYRGGSSPSGVCFLSAAFVVAVVWVDALSIASRLLALKADGIFIQLKPQRGPKLPVVVRTGRAVVYVTAAPSLQGSTGEGGSGEPKSRNRHSDGKGEMDGRSAQWVEVRLARACTRLPGH